MGGFKTQNTPESPEAGAPRLGGADLGMRWSWEYPLKKTSS